jgi:hypothetical protein
MTTNTAPKRPSDIVSPITDSALPNTTSASEARKAGRFGHEKPTPDNSIVLLIDHQIGLMAGVRDFVALSEYKSNWKLPSANDMLAPFNHNLSEYGFVTQNFWNNANQHAVPDPFGMVK